MMTETWADWLCENCDSRSQLFLVRNDNGQWIPTHEAQDILEYHRSDACHGENSPVRTW